MRPDRRQLCSALIIFMLSSGVLSAGIYCMDTGHDASEELKMVAKYFIKDIDALALKACPADSVCVECKSVSEMGIRRYQATCQSKTTKNKYNYCRVSNPCTSPTDSRCHPVLQEIRNSTRCRAVAIGPIFEVQVPDLDGLSVYCNDMCGSLLGYHKQSDLSVFIGCAEECRLKMKKLPLLSTSSGGSDQATCTTCTGDTGCIEIPTVPLKNLVVSWLNKKRGSSVRGGSSLMVAAAALAAVIFLRRV